MKARIFSTLFIVMFIFTFSGAALASDETCAAGGPGASECQFERSLTILGIPIIDQTGPSVTCTGDTYACCGPNTAVCIPNGGVL
ncbi:hypothetical protein [Roseivirga echinicomitans]|uniref:Uncharacterized protein n=1 Tax=Roseivirga echinicomitans TaxID=296218 RepID=A0A150XY89_9BACT|nr:hypothetical protein [Roseivirga echinicomitans]KYG83565.1 hypothetical protein AWN68_01815 [Roseivirga echinicomitans]